MPRLPRLRLPPTWRKALRVDSDLAEAEGLAAGTGLLTGEVVQASGLEPADCPECGGIGDAVVVDLVARSVSRRCQSCGHRWTADDPVTSRSIT